MKSDWTDLTAHEDSVELAEARARSLARHALAKRFIPVAEQHDLTTREYEVLQLIMLGYENKEIMEVLQRGRSTVRTHIHHILHKLGAKNRAHAVALFLQRIKGDIAI